MVKDAGAILASNWLKIASVGLCVVAFVLRWPHPEFQWQHIDERAFVTVPLGFWSGDLNPHFFNYPTFHFYLMSLVYLLYYTAFSAESIEQFLAFRYFIDDADLIGLARSITTLFAVGTVAVVTRLGKRLYGNVGALTAGFMVAVLPLHVRYSHLAITDTPATFWVSLSLLGAIRIAQRGRRQDYLLAGVCGGLAAATKYPAGIVLVAAGAAALLGNPNFRFPRFWLTGSAFVAFFLTTPYVWLDHSGFWADFSAMGMVHLAGPGHNNPGNSALVYHVKHSLFNGVGLAVMGVLVAAIVWMPRNWRKEEVILLIFVVGFSAVLLAAGSVFMRYTLPLVPALAVLLFRPFDRLPGSNVLLVIWVSSLLVEPAHASWKLRTQLSGSDTRIEARQWLNDTLPNGGRIAHDSTVGSFRTVTPSFVLNRQRHVLKSFNLTQITQMYATLAVRSDLPPFYVSMSSEALEDVLASSSTERSAVILFSYHHPLIGKVESLADRVQMQQNVTQTFEPGDLTDATFDWVDFYYLPIGGTYELELSGPKIRATIQPVSIVEPVPTTSEYFALLSGLVRANAFVSEDNWPAAALELQRVQETPFRMSELLSDNYLYNLTVGLGMVHFRRGAVDTALKYWRMATRIIPSKAIAYYHMGEAYQRLGQLETAVESYQLALERNNNNVRLLHNVGAGLVMMGRFEDGIVAMERAVNIEPEADTYVNLGVAYDRSGMEDKQHWAFRKALELDPRHPQSASIRSILDSVGSTY